MARRTGKPVARHSAFWDASALVPLCVRQGITARAIAQYQSYDAIVWWATPVEIASALARLVSMKQLGSGDWTKARKLAKVLADSWCLIQASNILRSKAVQLVERDDLRAADSLQLATLAWCEDTPSRTCLSDHRSKTEGSGSAQRLRRQGNMISDLSREGLHTCRRLTGPPRPAPQPLCPMSAAGHHFRPRKPS